MFAAGDISGEPRLRMQLGKLIACSFYVWSPLYLMDFHFVGASLKVIILEVD